MQLLVSYFLIINAAGFLSMLADKHRSRKNAWRIPERTLLLMAALGGSIGSLLGMYLFRHKTRKPKFIVGIPLILAIQVIALIWIYLL